MPHDNKKGMTLNPFFPETHVIQYADHDFEATQYEITLCAHILLIRFDFPEMDLIRTDTVHKIPSKVHKVHKLYLSNFDDFSTI